MLKKVSLAFAILFCIMFVGSKAFAESGDQNDGAKIIFKAKEITDVEELNQKMIKGEHENIKLGKFADAVLDKKQIVELSSDNVLGGSSSNVEVEEVSPVIQLLEIKEDEDGSREETYSLNYIIDVEETEDGHFNLSNSNSRTRTDPSGSVRATSTAYFVVKNDSSGVPHARFSRGNGKWTILQTGVFLSNRVVNYGTTGNSKFGSTIGQTRSHKPSGNSWSVTAPSNWNPATGHVGVTSLVSLTGRTSYRLSLINEWF